MTGYERQPAAYERKNLPACSETQGYFNRHVVNDPAPKIGFTNNYRRLMGGVQSLNHFNHRAERTWTQRVGGMSAGTECCWEAESDAREKKLKVRKATVNFQIPSRCLAAVVFDVAATRHILQEAETRHVRVRATECRVILVFPIFHLLLSKEIEMQK